MTNLVWNDLVRPPVTTADARLELAAVCRLVAREGMAPIATARIAARDPERPDVYLVNPGGLLLEGVRASTLIAIDSDGVRLDDGKAEPDSGALALVLAALEATPDAVAAAQAATIAGCAISSLEDGLIPMTQTTFMFHGAIGCHDWDPALSKNGLHRQIASDMAGCTALLVRGRGLLVTGKTLAQTWKLLFFLDKCCRSQVDAMAAANASGRSITIPSNAVIDHTVNQSRAFIDHPRFVADWPNCLDQLDREDPSFRT